MVGGQQSLRYLCGPTTHSHTKFELNGTTPRRSNGYENLGAVRYLGFDLKLILKLLWHWGPITHNRVNFQCNRAIIDDWVNFHRRYVDL